MTDDVLAELDRRLAAVRAAEVAVTTAEAHERTARRGADRASGPLLAYHEQVAAGEREPDPDHERELLTALREAQATVTLRASYSAALPGSEGAPRMVSVDPVDLVAEAALIGARRAADERRAELTAFVAASLDELCAARVPLSVQAGSRMRVALETVDAADA